MSGIHTESNRFIHVDVVEFSVGPATYPDVSKPHVIGSCPVKRCLDSRVFHFQRKDCLVVDARYLNVSSGPVKVVHPQTEKKK